jgi:hypothetical protein
MAMSRRYPSQPKPYFQAGANPRYSGYKVTFKDVKAQDLSEGVGMPDAGNCSVCGEWESELAWGWCTDCRTPEARIQRAKEAIKQGERQGLVYVEDMGSQGIHIKKLR